MRFSNSKQRNYKAQVKNRRSRRKIQISQAELLYTALLDQEGKQHFNINNILRAPLLVAIALLNKGCPPEKAISIIRSARPGAINQ